MAGNSVEFKANANGLIIVFDKSETFESIYKQISRKLESGGFFFQTRYLATAYRGRKLSTEEEGAISRMMSEKTGARTVLFEIDRDFERDMIKAEKNRISGAESGGVGGSAITGTGGSAITGTGASAITGTGASAGTRADGGVADTSVAGSGGTSGGAAGGSAITGTGGSAITGTGASAITGTGGSAITGTGAGAITGTGASAITGTGAVAGSGTAEAAAPAAVFRRRYSQADLDECITKYYRGTLRSGRLISYDGNVVIIGDVNPGAEVEATGNIIVLGNVRGIVHAGAGGNKEASIVALNFVPTQLRIADIITRRAERRTTGANAGYSPEIAFIKGDAIIFEPLVQNEGLEHKRRKQ